MATTQREDLYKVSVQTKDHPHVLEMIVSASSKVLAEARALGHIKEANPTKGRPLEESQRNSTVLFAKRTGKSDCLVTNKMPVNTFKAIARAVSKKT